MRRAVVAILVLLACSVSPASADLGMTMTMSMNAGGMAINGQVETRIKAMKMRSDVKVMQQDVSVFFDGVGKELLTANHATREITITDPAALAGQLPLAFGEASGAMKPTGQTKELLSRTCRGYAIDMTVPMTTGTETAVMKMSGTVWIADKGPGVEEYRVLTRAAVESGFPTAFMAQLPTTKGMIEIQKAMAEAGIPLFQEFQMTIELTGQAAAALAQMGNMTMVTTVTALTTDSIADEVFALPAGYTKK